MTDTPLPFAPFQPSPPTQPAAEKPVKGKRGPKKQADKTPPQAATAPAEKPPRQKRRSAGTAKPNKRSPKFDLQTILAAASTLKESDMPAFEKMIGMLQDAGKPGRERLLAALGKVFA